MRQPQCGGIVEDAQRAQLMLACLASFMIGLPVVDTTATRPITQLVHTRWTAKEGAPADVRALAQTPDGYLWLGTGSGLFRFDGVRFVPFAPRSGDSLPAGAISRLTTARDGSLWIVRPNGGVSRLHDGRLTSFGEPDGLPATFQLAESSRGLILAGTAKGLSRFANGRWEDAGGAWQFPVGYEARGLWFDRNDMLWVETNAEIVYLPAGAQQFVRTHMIVRDRASPTDFAQQADGTVWMNELARSAHTLRLLGDSGFASEVRVRATTVLVDRKGSLWVGSAGDGIRRVLDPGKFKGKVIARSSTDAEQFTMKDGLLSDIVTALLEDREGDIWVASSAGVERFRQGAFTPVAPLGPPRPRFLFATRDSSLWTAAQDMTGIVRLSRRDTATVPTNFLVTNLAQDSAGNIYTARNHRILRIQGQRFVPLSLQKVVAINLVDITVDRGGTTWLYDEDAGLLRLDGDHLTPVAPLYEPVARRGALFADTKGRIWIGQLNRVAMYDHGTLSLYGLKEGVPPGLVFQVLEDRAGNIWVAGDGGLSKLENGRFRTIGGRGFPGKTVFGVAQDDMNAWWMVTKGGVLRVGRGEIDHALADSTYAIRYRIFDQQDGLPGIVTVSNWGSPVTRTADGRIWIATDSGVASADPRNLPRDLPLPVLIESVRIGGRDLSPSDAAPIAAGRGDLEIDYTATGLAIPARVQFRYRLEGEDSSWHDVGNQRRVSYNGLAPGSYRFRVAARNGDGTWDESASSWDFRVLPPWYRTLWFQGAALLLIVGAGAGATSLVQRQRHLRSQQLLRSGYEATLAERARIAQDLHDTLLQGIAGVSMQLKAAERALPDEPDVAAETLIHVQRLTRETMREARERVMDLHEPDLGDSDLAGALKTSGEGLVAATGITFLVTISGERRRLSRVHEVAAIRIAREAIANAVHHAEARRIDVVVGFEPAMLRLEVRDDGRGFTREEGERARQQGHLGLTGMQSRAERAGGRYEVRPGSGGGTVVAVEFPLNDGKRR